MDINPCGIVYGIDLTWGGTVRSTDRAEIAGLSRKTRDGGLSWYHVVASNPYNMDLILVTCNLEYITLCNTCIRHHLNACGMQAIKIRWGLGILYVMQAYSVGIYNGRAQRSQIFVLGEGEKIYPLPRDL